MIEKIDSSREAVRKTGKAFLIGGSAIALVLFLGSSHVAGWTGWDFAAGLSAKAWKWFLGCGAGLWILSLVSYTVMKPIHIGWMTFAFILGWINTRILLGIFYYIILTPIGLVMRLFGKDLLDEKIDKSKSTYWIDRPVAPVDRSQYERLF